MDCRSRTRSNDPRLADRGAGGTAAAPPNEARPRKNLDADEYTDGNEHPDGDRHAGAVRSLPSTRWHRLHHKLPALRSVLGGMWRADRTNSNAGTPAMSG